MRPRRRRAVVASAAVVIAALVVAPSARTVVAPEPGVDPGTGPVAVLGGAALRLDHARTLAGVADGERELIVLGDAAEDLTARGGSCDAVGVTCLTPERSTTFGEVIALAALADARGIDRLTVVTSDFHVGRTRWLLDACVDADVTVVAAPDPAGAPLRAFRVVRESVALARSRLLDRC